MTSSTNKTNEGVYYNDGGHRNHGKRRYALIPTSELEQINEKLDRIIRENAELKKTLIGLTGRTDEVECDNGITSSEREDKVYSLLEICEKYNVEYQSGYQWMRRNAKGRSWLHKRSDEYGNRVVDAEDLYCFKHKLGGGRQRKGTFAYLHGAEAYYDKCRRDFRRDGM